MALLFRQINKPPVTTGRIAQRNSAPAKPRTRLAYSDFEVSAPQHEFLSDDTTEHIALIGGIGSGKSFALMAWHAMEQFRQRDTGTVGGVFANTYQQLSQATLPHLWAFLERMGMEYGRDFVYNEVPPRYWRYSSRFPKHSNVITIREWGQSITRSLDNPHALRGVELGFASMDEVRDTKQEAFHVVLGRLRCPKSRDSVRRLRVATTPNGFDWVYDEFVERAKELDGVRRIIHAPTHTNFAIDAAYVQSLRRSYDSRMVQQEVEGLFVPIATGLVYHEFRRTEHVVNAEPSPNLDVLVSFDFNRSPFCVILAQRVPRVGGDILVVFDEIKLEDAQTQTACDEVFRRLPTGFARRVAVYGDASGRAKDTRNNRSDYDIITQKFNARFGGRFDAKWPRSNPSVMQSINETNAMLRNGEGRKRLFVNEKCVNLRRDLERVSYRPGTREIDKTKDRSLTHASDALRYLIHAEFPISVVSAAAVHW